jgi:hypothetical protein
VPGTVDSYVWYDADADGVRGSDEGGYTDGALTVRLISVDGDVVQETASDPADGSFKLEHIVPGTYELEFSAPHDAGVAFTKQNAGQDDARDSDVDPATGRAPLVLASGDYVTDVSAGVTTLPSIGPNLVFLDADADGVLDPVEEGLAGVVVVLYHQDGTQADVTVTDGDGEYSFSNLEADAPYYISVNNDPSFVFSPVVDGGNQIAANDDTPYKNASPTITLGNGETDRTLVVGMFERVTVGNRVWNDLNGNGVQDADEPGMAEVIVMLIDGNTGVQIGPDVSLYFSYVFGGVQVCAFGNSRHSSFYALYLVVFIYRVI